MTWLSKIIKSEYASDGYVTPLKMENFSSQLVSLQNDEASTISAPPDLDISLKESELEKVKDEAFKDGFDKGKKEGEKLLRLELEALMRSLSESLLVLDSFREKLLKDSENEVVALILGATKKITKREITTNKDIIVTVIKNAIKCLTDRREIIIRIHPGDYTLIEENKVEFFGHIDDLKNISFREDDTVGEGGCLIESRFGEIDARIETQLERLEDGIKSAIS